MFGQRTRPFFARPPPKARGEVGRPCKQTGWLAVIGWVRFRDHDRRFVSPGAKEREERSLFLDCLFVLLGRPPPVSILAFENRAPSGTPYNPSCLSRGSVTVTIAGKKSRMACQVGSAGFGRERSASKCVRACVRASICVCAQIDVDVLFFFFFWARA